MPRTRQRFSRLNAELKASLGTAAAGTRAADYLNFLKGTNRIRITRKLTGDARARFSVGIVPFGLTPGATPRAFQASMTYQAENIRAMFNTAANDNAYGIRAFDNTTETDALYYPALVKIFVTVLNATSTPETSGILKTQGTYRSFKGRSGSIPFGRTVSSTTDAETGTVESALGDVDEEDVKRSLAADLKGAREATYKVKGISFVSESWGSRRSVPGNKAATLPAFVAPA